VGQGLVIAYGLKPRKHMMIKMASLGALMLNSVVFLSSSESEVDK